MLSQESDQALVKTYLRKRDERSFRELYSRHTPALYVLALRLCRSEVDAHDAIQDTWIRACNVLLAFRWESNLRTWLTGILINCVRELSRRRYRQQEEPLPDNWPVTISERSEERMILAQIVARLPDGYRHVLTLHDVEGYTHEEISVLLDISVGTSKSQLHHARRAIRKVFLLEEPT